MVLATWITRQLVFDGFVTGLVFGLLAVGVVLVYRSTRVINFAVGNMGVVGAGLFAVLVVQYGVPFWLAAVIALAAGTAYGAVLELGVIRRLFDAPRVIVVVATIGIAQLSLALLVALPDIDAPGQPFPQALTGDVDVGSITVRGPQMVVVLVVPVLVAALAWLLTRTAFGKSVKASAENRDLARLNGINPKRVSLLVWSIAGALATVSLALVAGQNGSAIALAQLGPSTLSRALVAAVVGGMVSFGRAFGAGIAIGVAEAVLGFNFPDQSGLVDFVLLGVVLVAVFLQHRGEPETRTFAFVPKRRPVPDALAGRWWVRQLDRVGLLVLLVLAVVVPLVVDQSSRHLLYTTILVFALCGLSLTILTGWAGQLSLGQMAFAGIGALLAAAFERGVVWDVGIGDGRLRGGIVALPLGVSMVVAALVTAVLACAIGVGALRIRGQLLAVSTFVFGLAAMQYLYQRPLLVGDFTTSIPLRRGELFGIDVSGQRSYYFLVLAVLVAAVAVVGRLRRTGVGRSVIGVRDNPAGAAAYTVRPTAAKLRAFALAGGMAGLGGALLAANLQNVPTTRFFTVTDSLMLVSVVVIGGLGSVTGPILGSLWVVGLPAFFPDNDLVPLLSSSVGLLVLLLYFPGGLVQLGHLAHDAVIAVLERRLPAPSPTRAHVIPTSLGATTTGGTETALATRAVTVRFGGIVSVDTASIHVGAGEVVGLIGTNGAGKTTLMNAISGFARSTGSVELLGADLNGLPPATRARRGLGRTFQAAPLFAELTVRETVQLALEARHRTGFLGAALCLPASVNLERARRRQADELLGFLGLGPYATIYVSDLSTGTRRIVELAGLLALDARVLLLDEPTGGLAQRETEAFGPLILDVRAQLGASILVIEHDMPLIMGISDRVYCLEAGRVIADGRPEDVRHDPAVVASYLGTDERAIARSGRG
jgi:ABC-type branched-subunit amino acid transport system ATPase component/ABC-type branched-subunit amino acid transport system permease subunit